MPEMKELAGGADDWLLPGDAPLRVTWTQVPFHVSMLALRMQVGHGMINPGVSAD